jgi:hypothetical protein
LIRIRNGEETSVRSLRPGRAIEEITFALALKEFKPNPDGWGLFREDGRMIMYRNDLQPGEKYELRYFVKCCPEQDRVIRYWKIHLSPEAGPATAWRHIRNEMKGVVDDMRCYDKTWRWIRNDAKLIQGMKYTFMNPREDRKIRWQVIQSEHVWETLRPLRDANEEIGKERANGTFRNTMIRVNGHPFESQILKENDVVQIINKDMQKYQIPNECKI